MLLSEACLTTLDHRGTALPGQKSTMWSSVSVLSVCPSCHIVIRCKSGICSTVSVWVISQSYCLFCLFVCLSVLQCLVMSRCHQVEVCDVVHCTQMGVLREWFHQFREYLDGHVLGCHFIEIFALVSYVNMLIKSVNSCEFSAVNSCEFSATQLIHELCIQSN